MKNVITLENVEYKELRAKILAYASLVGKRSINVYAQVQGFFKDLDGELVFLNLSFHDLDTSLLGYDWVCVKFDGTWNKLVPAHDEIEYVRIFEE